MSKWQGQLNWGCCPTPPQNCHLCHGMLKEKNLFCHSFLQTWKRWTFSFISQVCVNEGPWLHFLKIPLNETRSLEVIIHFLLKQVE